MLDAPPAAWYNGAERHSRTGEETPGRVKSYYQIALDVEGRHCVVVGGGAEAVEKTERLLEAGARVTVVAPEVAPELQAWADAGRLTLHQRAFTDADAQGAFLVQLCVKGDAALAARLYRLGEEQHFLVGAWDQPECSHYTMPALLRRGRLRLAISTGGASPALAGALRAQLEQLFDAEFEAYLEWLAEQRRALADTEPDRARRAAAAREAVAGLRIEGSITYPEAYTKRPA